MNACTLKIEGVGPINHANVRFGDLTVLVGPQATGKSILLEFLKLLVDTGAILDILRRYGLTWDKDFGRFLDIYLGEGMRGVWRKPESKVHFNGDEVDLEKRVGRQRRNKEESMFLIPAQRVLTLGKGWPRPFADYGAGDPFTVRDFSEKIRLLTEGDPSAGRSLYPRAQRLRAELRSVLRKTVFGDFALHVDTHGAQKRLVLSSSRTGDPLPFMVWSAGQREFVPLLLGMFWLLPSAKTSRRDTLEWVVIEEPEMGLHPRAISAVLLLVLELLSRGYRVSLSTHSPHVLDVVWALNVFRQHDADPRRLLSLFGVGATGPMVSVAKRVLAKQVRVYYFDPTTGQTRDISHLDPGAAETAESGWGGLVEFSGQVADAVAATVAASTGK
jgi:hypothetical protein